MTHQNRGDLAMDIQRNCACLELTLAILNVLLNFVTSVLKDF